MTFRPYKTMKASTHLLIAVLLLLLSACSQKEGSIEILEPPLLTMQSQGLLNGDSLVINTYAVKTGEDNKFRLEFDASDPTVPYHRNVSFSQISYTVGLVDSLFGYAYPALESRLYCNYTAASGDAIYAFYDLVENDPINTFEITEINEEENLIKGNFEIKLAIEEGHSHNEELLLEDTIHLKLEHFVAPLRR